MIIEHRKKGAIVRSKSQWYNEGENNNKYFLNLEKRHCKQGTITQLKVNSDDRVCSDKEILNECDAFYQNLSLRSRRKRERGRGARTREKNGFWELGTRERLLQRPHFFISAHRFLGNPIKLAVNATTNQKQAHAFLHD